MGNDMKKVELEDGQSADIVSENISKLKELFPDAFSEGGQGKTKIDFDTLRQLLGDASVLDEGEEKYGLNWHGKKKARQIALTPSTGTLLPCPDESVDWDTTQNLFIEGDNLEVLKLLQKSYANKIKMIYIDPPYNTGKEFIYPDRFQENLDTYLKYTGQVDDEGVKFSSNTETTGRKHTNWLNMMYSRLKVARNLLSGDGFVCVSIDENEVANLRLILNEVYGEENFVGAFVWKKGSGNNDAEVSYTHDQVLVYRKSIEAKVFPMPQSEAHLASYKNPDNDHRGNWTSSDYTSKWSKEERPNLWYAIPNPNTGQDCFPPEGRTWAYGQDETKNNIADSRLWWGKSGTNERPRYKRFIKDTEAGMSPRTFLDTLGSNEKGFKDFRELGFTKDDFPHPKPLELIEFLLSIFAKNGGLILDFFAGSGATAHSVIRLAREQNIDYRYILVQLPEPIEKSKYKTISEVARRRIEKCQVAVQGEYDKQCSGFRLFKLGHSNINIWNPDRADLEKSLLSHEEHIVEGRKNQDILYELLLKRGVDLAVPIESCEVSGKNIYSIGYGVLFACLDDSIIKDQVEDIAQAIIAWYGELAPSSDTHVFFRDSAFRDDVSKTNMSAILEQNGITHVRSL